jgi:hypothetical protein
VPPLARVAVTYVPSAESMRVRYIYNRDSVGNDDPYISPYAATLDVTAGRKLFTLPACSDDAGAEPCARGGSLDLFAYPVAFDDEFSTSHPRVALVSQRGGSVVDVSPFTSFDPYTLVRRPPGVHILNVYQGNAGDRGMGMCGAARGYAFQVMTMDGDGKLRMRVPAADLPTLRARAPRAQGLPLAMDRCFLAGVEHLRGFEDQGDGTGAGLWIDSKQLQFFGLRGELSVRPDVDADTEAAWRPFEAGYRWNPATGTYNLFGRVDTSK